MILAVTGGRDYDPTPADDAWLDAIHQRTPITLLLDGGAKGTDTYVRLWAQGVVIWTVTYWPNWTALGTAAGPQRNERMLKRLRQEGILFGEPVALLCFPGGAGTKNCVTYARRLGIPLLPSPTAPWLAEAIAGGVRA
jgi:hypothetical protein